MIKAHYVSAYLSPLLYAADHSIVCAGYKIDSNGTETVTITYNNGHNVTVNVTANSLLAIVKDVIKAIE